MITAAEMPFWQRGGRTTEDRGMLGDRTMLGQC